MKRFLKLAGGVIALILAAGLVMLLRWSNGANRDLAETEIIAPEANAPGQFITVNGRQMHVLIKGDLDGDQTGAPLLLLHGFSIGAYETWFPFADRLGSDRTLIIPDMLNFGHSERVTEPHSDLTHAGQAALLDGLLEALGVGQVDMVGRSYGGAVGSNLILDFPDRVRRMIFVGAHVYWDDDFLLAQQLSRLPFGIGRAMTWNSIGGGSGGFVGRACEERQENCDRLKILRIKDTVDGLHALNALKQVSRVPAEIAKVSVPSLVIWGGADPIVPLEDGERLADVLGVDLKVVPGAGHWPYEKDPETVKTWMLEFLDP